MYSPPTVGGVTRLLWLEGFPRLRHIRDTTDRYSGQAVVFCDKRDIPILVPKKK